MDIHRAGPDDAAAVAAVFDAAVREGWRYLGDLVDAPLFSPREWDEQLAALAPPNGLFVAADTAGILGFTAVRPADCELFLLFVHPDHSGRGVGRRLLDTAHAELRRAGCAEASLFTHEQNERARALYERAGYAADGHVRESDFRGVALREPRLVKRL